MSEDKKWEFSLDDEVQEDITVEEEPKKSVGILGNSSSSRKLKLSDSSASSSENFQRENWRAKEGRHGSYENVDEKDWSPSIFKKVLGHIFNIAFLYFSYFMSSYLKANHYKNLKTFLDSIVGVEEALLIINFFVEGSLLIALVFFVFLPLLLKRRTIGEVIFKA